MFGIAEERPRNRPENPAPASSRCAPYEGRRNKSVVVYARCFTLSRGGDQLSSSSPYAGSSWAADLLIGAR